MQDQSNRFSEIADKARKQLAPIEGPVLNWLPGESLYSLIARNHFYRGHMMASHTIQAFFGSLTGMSLQQNMTEIDVFVARTESRLGDAQQVLEERTLLGFYRIFMRAQDGHLIEPGRKSVDSMLKFPMALRTGPFRTKHPLKACAVCLEHDIEHYGFPYWRIAHQFPGMWVCLEHNNGLQGVAIKPPPHEKFLWQTPTESPLLALSAALTDQQTFAIFKELAQLIISITSERGHGTHKMSENEARFRQHLSKTGMGFPADWQKMTYRPRVDQLCRSFVEFSERLRKHAGFSELPSNVESSFQLLSRYLNGKSFVHPLERLVIAAWIERFVAAP